jgi:hypothetical protein
MSYIIRAVSELNDNIVAAASQNGETVVKFKNKEKKGYFFVVPTVTDAFVQSFITSDKGLNAAKDWIESLIKNAGKARFDAGQGFSAADITIDALCSVAEAVSDNIRCSKENIVAAFDADWVNRIAYCIALERDANAAVMLEGDVSATAYWSTEQGAKMMQIASNYKPYFVRASERKPTFETQAIKDKVVAAVQYLDESQLQEKVLEKLQNAPVAVVDVDAL